MEREIKFRGIRKDNGKMDFFKSIIQAIHENEVKIGFIESFWYNESEGFFNPKFIEVKPETVGQFTGLKDKNGADLYEGDIVNAWSQGSNAELVVKWGVSRFFLYKEIGGLLWSLTSNKENIDEHLEIIGNIHNPHKKP